MPNFIFDDAKGFDENLDAFLDQVVAEDAEMGAILRVHISKLKGGVEEVRRTARAEFNTGVKSALDNLLSTAEEEKAG